MRTDFVNKIRIFDIISRLIVSTSWAVIVYNIVLFGRLAAWFDRKRQNAVVLASVITCCHDTRTDASYDQSISVIMSNILILFTKSGDHTTVRLRHE